MNIGAGRVVMQDLPRIDAAIVDGMFGRNPALVSFIEKLKTSGGSCHLMELLSPGGVHSHQNHLVALVKEITSAGVPVCLHAFLDGRDTPPDSGHGFLHEFLGDVEGAAGFSVATITGRYYAMDRDNNWDRVVQAYNAMSRGDGSPADDPLKAIQDSYDAGVQDEFVKPVVVGGYEGMTTGDGVLMANYRADRAREVLAPFALGSLAVSSFDRFDISGQPEFAALLGMSDYSAELSNYVDSLYPSEILANVLGQVVADAGGRQLRIAETEKYAHVTFFLNGGREDLFPGEERILVPSPKVATYDLQPEMSAPEVTDKLIEAIGSGKFELVVVNFANGDMVGHTGIMEAAIKAVETLDASLGKLETAIQDAGGVMMITADHGNCEMMVKNGGPHTAHTTNNVPFVMVGGSDEALALENGKLCDIAPTLLELLKLKQPPEMTGKSLLVMKT